MMVFRRFNRSNALRPVNRIKHVTDQQFVVPIGGGNTVIELIKTVDAPVLANVTECETGSTVNGIYIVCEALPTSEAALSNLYMNVVKNPGNNITEPLSNGVGFSDEKRFVIHQEMVMGSDSVNANPRTVFKGVVKIPRNYKRNAPNDRLKVTFFSPGISWNVCVQSHYKEFR